METKDIQEDWGNEMEEINETLRKKGAENGISKEQYKLYKFQEFNLTEAVPRSKCAKCRAGVACKVHTFQRDQTTNFFSKDEKENKENAKPV